MINEYYVRPIAPSDFEGLLYLAEESGLGFTSLQPDPPFLKKKIQASLDSFNDTLLTTHETNYFFVCEHIASKRLVGTCAIKNNIGTDALFYCLKISRLSRESQELNKRLEHKALCLSSDYHGATELCSLLVLPSHRKKYNGQLLSRCRYLFMANFPEQFNELVIAQMRGICDDNGISPFWEAIGRKFFGLDFPEADYLAGIGKKQFISDLMPTSQFYISMLPPEAQAVIGQVHPNTASALKLLKAEGFRYRNYVDLSDGGPILESDLQNIHTFRDQRVVTVINIQDKELTTGQPMLLSSTGKNFRALVNCVKHKTEESVVISRSTAELLQTKKGDPIRIVSIHGKK